MGAMSSMDDGDDGKGSGKKPVDLAIIMGKPGGKPPIKMPGDDGDDKHSEDELPPGFEEAFSEAFPDAAGDTDKMQALKRLIQLCGDDSSNY